MSDVTSEQKKRTSRSLVIKYLLVIAIVSLLTTAGVVSYYFYTKYQATQTLLKDPSKATRQQIDSLVAEVGALIDLPQGENPTVATVSDPGKLKGQAFFSKAIVGDKVLIYPQAKKAILYRPSTRKIIEVGPVSFSTPTPTGALVSPALDDEKKDVTPTKTRPQPTETLENEATPTP